MKEILPSPPPLVHNQFEAVRDLFSKNVVPSYGRFDLVLSHGQGSYIFDVAGKRYLDLGSGIAVSALATRTRPSRRRSSNSPKSSSTSRTSISPSRRAGWPRKL